MKKLKKIWMEFGQIFKNFSYNLSYQVLSLILPIITVPYITRTLSQELVGLNTVIQANCTYFVLFGMMGVTILGPREIAKYQEDKEKIALCFSRIYSIQVLFHMLAIVSYFLYVILGEKSSLYMWYLLFIFSSLTDISWLYIGLEDFKAIAIRNFGVKITAFILLFILVKSDDDIVKYIFTMYVPQLVINMYMWYIAIKRKYIKVFFSIRRNLLIESISLFIPNVASSIYTILDKTVLSFFEPYIIVAIYAQAQVIIRLILAIVPSFSKVMMPRISNCIYRKDEEKVIKYMKMSANIIMAVSIILFIGTIIGSQLFVDWYLPKGYESAGAVLRLCSPIILAVSISNLLAIQFLIPMGKQKEYTISIFAATFMNIILNIMLAPILGMYGVCIGSVVAEWTGMLIQIFFARKYIDVRDVFRGTYYYWIAGSGAFITLWLIKGYFSPILRDIVLFALLGGIIYVIYIILILSIKKYFINIRKK